MFATLVNRSVIEVNAILLTGLDCSSPTHCAIDPDVCIGMLMLNGTLRKPGMRPRIVIGRRNSMNSDAIC